MELLYVSLRDDAKLNMPLVQNFLALAHPPSETVARWYVRAGMIILRDDQL